MTEPINPFASPQTVNELESRPDIVWQGEHRSAMQTVRLGLLLVYTSICGMLLSVILMGVLTPLLGNNEFVGAITLIFSLTILGFALAYLVGMVLCLWVPEQSQAKGFAIAAVAMQVFGMLTNLVTPIVVSSPLGTSSISGATNLLGIASAITFLFFIKKTALFINRPDLSRQAGRAMITWGMSVCLGSSQTGISIVIR